MSTTAVVTCLMPMKMFSCSVASSVNDLVPEISQMCATSFRSMFVAWVLRA